MKTKNKKKSQNLYIHVGLPKCASTTLQYDVFPQFDVLYLGRKRNSQDHSDIMGDVCNTLGSLPTKDINKNKLQLRNLFLKIKKKINDEEKMIVLSEEAFTCPDYFDFSTFGCKWQNGLIKKRSFWKWTNIIKSEWKVVFGGDVKYLIVLRNQKNFLISLYTQFSQYNMNPSQEDFENQVKKLFHDPYYADMIDYYKILKPQIKIFKKNLEILFFEDFGKKSFWNWCNKYSKKNKFKKSLVSVNNARVVKIGIKQKYFIPNLGSRRSFLDAFVRRPWRLDYLVLSQSIWPCNKYRSYINSKRKKQPPIEINKDLYDLINSKYKNNNFKLANFIGKNLSKMNYY